MSTNALTDSRKLTLFVKDRFSLLDTAYHELAMICEQLSCLNKLKKMAKILILIGNKTMPRKQWSTAIFKIKAYHKSSTFVKQGKDIFW